MTRQELDNLIFASRIVHSIQTSVKATIKESYGISSLQQVYDILAMIIKDNSVYLKNYENEVKVEVK